MTFYKHVLIILILSEHRIFVSNQFHRLMANLRKLFTKKLYLTINSGILLELRIEQGVC